ncbi:MAG: hypothetical protein AUG51_09685 [Acidobacteria bacterium 13_1_20CM_3_53_8]|nr:MAG: hypothetical protein AUG51_09685 [Acidobacteria bacterium 13_1_20CM_3_53_8]
MALDDARECAALATGATLAARVCATSACAEKGDAMRRATGRDRCDWPDVTFAVNPIMIAKTAQKRERRGLQHGTTSRGNKFL